MLTEAELLIIAKLFLATVIGMTIGLERTLSFKNAGIRTHSLLCLTTCLLTCLSDSMLPNETPRIISGIVQGIGFIGAGVIFIEKGDSVKGLTSSVILWFTGIMGIVVGSKYWIYAIDAFVFYLFIIIILKKLEKAIKEK